jgi:hypothetical protein
VNSPGDPRDVTNANGQYDFYTAAASSLSLGVTFNQGDRYVVGVVLPPAGYQVANGGPTTTTFTYNGGTSTVVDFEVWQRATIAGTVFKDLNGDGVQQPNEPGVSNTTVYLDLNDDGQLDSGDPSTSSLNDGTYEFVGVAPSTYTVRYVLPDDYLASAGPSSYSVPVLFSDDPMPGTTATTSPSSRRRRSAARSRATRSPAASWSQAPVRLDDQSAQRAAGGRHPAHGSDRQLPVQRPGPGHLHRAGGRAVELEADLAGHHDAEPGQHTQRVLERGQFGQAVTVADFDNDGKLDFAAFNSGTISYLYGNGDGTFGPVKPSPTPAA